MRLTLVITIAICCSMAACAAAQQTEAVLDDSGDWVDVSEGPEPGSDEATMREAARLIADNRPNKAKQILNRWIEENERSESAWLPHAYLLRGRARVASGNEYIALYDFERVVREFSGSEEFQPALVEEYKIATAYLRGLNRRFLGMRISPAESVGEELLIRTVERLPGSRLAEESLVELADYYFRELDLESASTVYAALLKNFPRSRYRQHAMSRRVWSNIAQFKGPRYDDSGLVEAKALIERYTSLYPADARAAAFDDSVVAWIEESQASKVLETARFYLRDGDPVSAKFTLQRLQRRHPNTVAAATARDMADARGWDLFPPASESSEPTSEEVSEEGSLQEGGG